jgi:5'-nucleotidase
VDAVVSGHTHRAYRCVVQGTSLTSAASHGRAFTRLSLRIDPAAHRVLGVSARNHVVTRDLTPDPRVDEIVRRARDRVRPVAEEVLGRLDTTLTRTRTAAGESPVGALVADAQLAATRSATTGSAQLAIVQHAALGADLRRGTITREQAYNVQPFGHRLVTMTLTGDQLDTVLEQQYCKKTAMTNDHLISLQVSRGFSYRWDPAAPCGNRVAVSDIRLDGVPVTGTTGYRVTVNELLAGGGQGITAFTAGTDRVTGPLDAQALESYLRSTDPVPVPALPRIEQLPPNQPTREAPPVPAPASGSATERVPTP